jgi:hypothetical protein
MYVFDMKSPFCWNEREGVVGMSILETMQASMYIVFIFIYIEKNINRMCIIRISMYSDVIIFLKILFPEYIIEMQMCSYYAYSCF